jgi:ABC-type dipeptide/oligopeptide/nickel transport system permease component/Zn-dependent M28 family amino/carboxypeptidase
MTLRAPAIARATLRRVGVSLGILLVIAALTFFGLILAERGQAGLPTEPLGAAVESLRRTLDYALNHPATYVWHREVQRAPTLVLTLFARSAALLLLSLLIAFCVGVPLGIAITLWRGGRMAPLILPLSVLGISIPSFLLAMLFWILNVQAGRWLGLRTAPLPPTGFGWDAHLLMPAIVLAMRPLAQLVQVTHVSLAGVLGADYIRTAHAKGLDRRVVINRHALRNILIPILTTLGVSLRFSLATLPVVELFFIWPGLGLGLVQAIDLGMTTFVVDLILALGLLFLVVNAGLELIYQIVDPRVRGQTRSETREGDRRTWAERWEGLRATFGAAGAWFAGLGPRLGRVWLRCRAGVSVPRRRPSGARSQGTARGGAAIPGARRATILASAQNPALLVGTGLVLGLAVLAVLGGGWTTANPYETHGVMMLEGTISAPPFPPSSTFPWGSDAVGRDIQALVLAGAKTTLTLALLAMLARVFLGSVLGLQAGWWRNGWMDRLIHWAMAVWAAFPVTLFAMILILALGIEQGMGVFVVALCIVGWGEIAQFVRGQVISLKPQPYIEGARMVGANSGRILGRHILPHLWAPLLVLAALEMASVLMLLAELGFLNIFLGGGFKAEIGEVGKMEPVIYYFSDVPEWGALLANIRNWWRSYPWMAWYPGVAFFLAILAFNLWGHGLRRFIDDSRVNIGRVINRYTVVATAVVLFGAGWMVRSTTPISVYSEQARSFDVARALGDIKALVSPRFQGRETGTQGALAAAQYIASRMEEIGLYPAGEGDSFLYPMAVPRTHLAGLPRLEILQPPQGATEGALEVSDPAGFTYREDFVEYAGYVQSGGEGAGQAVGLVLGPDTGEAGSGYAHNLMELDLDGKVLVLRQADYQHLEEILAGMGGAERLSRRLAGILIVTDDPGVMQRRDVYPGGVTFYVRNLTAMLITPETANRVLEPGSSLDELEALAGTLGSGQAALSPPGQQVRLTLPIAPDDLAEKYYHVIGYLPGSGSEMGERERGDAFGKDAVRGLDGNVVIVSAYYDGLGIGPDGTLYPGANDNASGVAAMLEIARALKASPAPPRKTVVFVAWSGGERREGFSVANAMAAKRGFNLLTVESVIELSGLGSGSGRGLALGPGTSFSLVQLFQAAADRVGVAVTTRGRGPHFGVETKSGFGGRSALSAYVSWDGSDETAHTAADTYSAIDPDKLRQAGETVLLVVSVLGQGSKQESPQGPLAPPTHYVDGARLFDEQQALDHIGYLSSDALEGRRPGTAGSRAAADYIAARFDEYGLLPAGPDGSYFQPFTVPYTTVVTAPQLSVSFPGGLDGVGAFTRTYVDHVDYWPRITDYMGSGDAEGPAVWLDDCREGSMAGRDLAGAVAVCRESNLTVYRKMAEEGRESKIGGLLLAVDGTGPLPRSSYASTLTLPFPAFYVFEPVAQDVLAGSGRTLDWLKRNPVTLPLSTTVHMAMGLGTSQVEARNVLGILPGSDPDHKDEVVIIGAHYDGIGRDPDGTIYNGAYCNASGVGAMLEIARMWHAQGYRPARSVLFAAWDDSEQGWFGAKHYVQHPAYPLDRTVAVLNLTMVGRGEDLTVDGRGLVADRLAAGASAYGADLKFVPRVTWGDSLPFHEAGVPTAMLWGIEKPGPSSVYHRPQDDAGAIQLEVLRAAGVLASHALAGWAGGAPTEPLRDAGPPRAVRDLILPTPTCPPPWPMGSMTCDHGRWSR